MRVSQSDSMDLFTCAEIAHMAAICGSNRPMTWPDGQQISRFFSCAAQLSGQVPQVQAGHLVLQRAERNSQVARSGGHVPVRLLQRPQDEVALEGVARFLEPRIAGRRR